MAEVRLVVWNQIPGMSESQWLPTYFDDRCTLVALVDCIDARYVAVLLYKCLILMLGTLVASVY